LTTDRLELLPRRQAGLYGLIKRSLDLVAALCLLPLLLPMFLVIAAAIRLDSRGPALYRGQRVGYLGRSFTMFKFRSMVCEANPSLHREYVQRLMRGDQVFPCGDGHDDPAAPDPPAGRATPRYKLPDDPRITRVGRVLRATSLDELPQLINVLKGEMSLVGPRPEVPYALAAYQPWQWQRFQVLPGLTGLWQVSGRSTLPPSEMLRLDVEYAQRCCLRQDMAILLRTIPELWRFDRAG
jgi:lipopolysaccharide/colanic/teichoic acid biosynthesis glycosyltransferase